MSLYIDRKYVLLVSTKLEHFKQNSSTIFNCRCKLCGDSKRNKLKARGYFYAKKGKYFYKCHNCHVSMTLGSFLKQIDPTLFSEYQVERYKDENAAVVRKPDFVPPPMIKPVFKSKPFDIPTIASLPNDHYAKQYVMERMIPKEYWNDLYFANDFRMFIEKILPNNDKKLKDNEPRLVIPFFDQKNILQGLQGRAFGESQVRYITYRVEEDMIKVFGLNKVDFTKPIMVVEGPIDSMFLKNSLATMDASLSRIIQLIGDYDYVFVHDNEKRNSEIVKSMRQSINTGKKVCIWPSHIAQKDVNDMVVAGLNPQNIISQRTFSGPQAMLELEMWRKV